MLDFPTKLPSLIVPTAETFTHAFNESAFSMESMISYRFPSSGKHSRSAEVNRGAVTVSSSKRNSHKEAQDTENFCEVWKFVPFCG